jgi:TonB family protein
VNLRLLNLQSSRLRNFLCSGIIFLLVGLAACNRSGRENSAQKDTSPADPPIYVVNGKVLSKDSARYFIPRLKQKYITDLHVVPARKAMLVFGKKASGGAIEYRIPNTKRAFRDLIEMNLPDSSQKISGKVYNVADKQPVIRGGLKKLEKQVKYPKKCKKAGIEGRVLVQIVVNKEGIPKNPKIIKGLGNGCDKEAIKIAKNARFIPGKVDGKSVNVKFLLPIIFSLR